VHRLFDPVGEEGAVDGFVGEGLYGGQGVEGFLGIGTKVADAILRAAPPPSLKRTILVSGDGSALRQAGFATVSSLGVEISVAEAKRLSCTHVLLDGQAVAVIDAN